MRSHPQPDAALLTGRTRDHIASIDAAGIVARLHRDVVEPFLALRDAAAEAGIDLRAASSFRDFDRQLAIWNAKYRGERTVLDRAGRVLDVRVLSPSERIEAILAWSALPGASRHHWGTDLDVYDAAAMPDAAQLQLVPQEYSATGVFAKLADWLDANLEHYGFFRPYFAGAADCAVSGVSPEPWHLSFAPLADAFLGALTPELLATVLSTAPIEGRDEVLARLGDIHRDYVAAVVPPSARSVEFEFREHGRVV